MNDHKKLQKDRRSLIVAATGASGFPVLVECLRILKENEQHHTILMLSDGAKLTLGYESDLSLAEVEELADETMDVSDIGAAPASGSFDSCGMLVVPCSMKTLAGIHSGYAENLLLRSADVTLKEHRPLVLGVRETPLSPIHLRNMQELSLVQGVYIMPLMLTYYDRPRTVEDMTRRMALRLLQPFGIRMPEEARWHGADAL